MLGDNLNKLAKDIYAGNKKRGFWPEDTPANKSKGEFLMLVVSELAEALEADRKDNFTRSGHALQALALVGMETKIDNLKFKEFFQKNVKDTFEDELADAMIRILDYCGANNIDIESHIETKVAYNNTREFKHGKKY